MPIEVVVVLMIVSFIIGLGIGYQWGLREGTEE